MHVRVCVSAASICFRSMAVAQGEGKGQSACDGEVSGRDGAHLLGEAERQRRSRRRRDSAEGRGGCFRRTRVEALLIKLLPSRTAVITGTGGVVKLT